MRIERELAWMVKLLTSEFVRPRLALKRMRSGCKRDFERIAGVPDSYKNFRLFLDVLIAEGILEFHERRSFGAADCFVVNGSKLLARIRQNPLYQEIAPIVLKEESELGLGL